MHNHHDSHPAALLPGQALPGRVQAMPLSGEHALNGHDMYDVPAGMEVALFAMGCFWGAERLFWQQPGIYSTAVGYSGGLTPNPTYREVCSGQTGHAETVRVVFDPAIIGYDALLRLFWQNHDPAQGMRQGNDIGTQYRSALYPQTDAQMQAAQTSAERFAQAMQQAGDARPISTEIRVAGPFYYAEEEHQQYLHKHPQGYCGLGGIGVCLPE